MADKPGLVDQYGRPIERAVLTQEVAAPTITGVRSPLTGYPGDGLNPQRLATIMCEADQGEPMRFLELAETIEERDLHYAGVLATRKRSVSQLDIVVEAAGDDAESVMQADMLREWLKREELQDELFDILDAVGKGFSFTEIIWDTSEGQWRPARLEWRDPRWFRFDRVDGKTPLMRDETGASPLPPFKFINAIIRAKSGLPIRSGLARIAAWSWMFKAFTLRDWAIFTQTYGQPIRVGKYPAGTTEADKDTLFRAVANIAGDYAAIIPESMAIEFIEAGNISGSVDLYERRADFLDKQVSKAVLGQTATTDAVTGGLGSGKEHRQVQEDIERADAKSCGAFLNRDLVRPWIDLERGPQKKYPRLRIGREDERDITEVSDALAKLVPFGLKVQTSEVRDWLGFSDPDPGAEVLAPATPSPAVPPLDPAAAQEARRIALNAAAVRAGPPQDEVDHLAVQTEQLLAPASDAMIDVIRGLVDRAESLHQVSEGLLKLKPDMPAATLAGLMQLALVMAELSGRGDIANG